MPIAAKRATSIQVRIIITSRSAPPSASLPPPKKDSKELVQGRTFRPLAPPSLARLIVTGGRRPHLHVIHDGLDCTTWGEAEGTPVQELMEL